MHRFFNFTDWQNKLHTQPSFADRRAELWAKWREVRDRNEAVKRYGVREINTKAVNNYHEVEQIKKEQL